MKSFRKTFELSLCALLPVATPATQAQMSKVKTVWSILMETTTGQGTTPAPHLEIPFDLLHSHLHIEE